jgi:hypothetical protein
MPGINTLVQLCASTEDKLKTAWASQMLPDIVSARRHMIFALANAGNTFASTARNVNHARANDEPQNQHVTRSI